MAFQTWEVHAWTARLPGAFLTATAVPMLYLLGREIFPTQLYGLMGAGVYLHPAAGGAPRSFSHAGWHHRLLFFIAMLWLWMRSRRHPPLYLVGGLCFALMCLTKGILGVLLLFIRNFISGLGLSQRVAFSLFMGRYIAGQHTGWWVGMACSGSSVAKVL